MKTSRRSDKRLAALLPNGVPKYVRCYDNGGPEVGGSGDRYTVCFTGRAGVERGRDRQSDPEYSYRAMSSDPFHPQGIGMWGSTKWHHCDVNKSGFAPAIGRKCHLGRRIRFQDLPPDCKNLVMSDYREIWKLETRKAQLK